MSMNKYYNRKTYIAGERFDSKHEAERWVELRLMERAGTISGLQRQVHYELIPALRDERGKLIQRAAEYVADFVYEENGQTVVEDAKGYPTAEYRLKKKLMLWRHGILIREV